MTIPDAVPLGWAIAACFLSAFAGVGLMALMCAASNADDAMELREKYVAGHAQGRSEGIVIGINRGLRVLETSGHEITEGERMAMWAEAYPRVEEVSA